MNFLNYFINIFKDYKNKDYDQWKVKKYANINIFTCLSFCFAMVVWCIARMLNTESSNFIYIIAFTLTPLLLTPLVFYRKRQCLILVQILLGATSAYFLNYFVSAKTDISLGWIGFNIMVFILSLFAVRQTPIILSQAYLVFLSNLSNCQFRIFRSFSGIKFTIKGIDYYLTFLQDSWIILYLVIIMQIVSLIIRVNLKELYNREKELKSYGETDNLTGCWNRNKLYKDILMNGLIKENSTLMMIDADNFKQINDTYGHKKGDETLKEIVSAVNNIISKEDYLIRYGGDEFLVIIKGFSEQKANSVFNEIKKKKISVSCGYSVCYQNVSFDYYFNCVDKTMYDAKKEKGKILKAKLS